MSSVACCGGSIDSGIPTGTEVTVNGIKCYLAKSDVAHHKTIIIATDIFGYTLPNVRLMADRFALAGFSTYVPDLFKGREVPSLVAKEVDVLMCPLSSKEIGVLRKIWAVMRLLWYAVPFMIRNSHDKGVQVIHRVIQGLEESKERHKLFALGYCWGGSIVIRLAQDARLSGVVSVHPGPLQDNELNAMAVPALIQLPEHDPCHQA